VADPRRSGCGPECDGAGICAPVADTCGGEAGRTCTGDKVCLRRPNCVADEAAGERYTCGGLCLPLRFGSDSYEKSRAVEVTREDQDGRQIPEEVKD